MASTSTMEKAAIDTTKKQCVREKSAFHVYTYESLPSVPTEAPDDDSASSLIEPLSPMTRSSHCMFADPSQNIIILDWDDTLFPTTEICDTWGFTLSGTYLMTNHQRRALRAWRLALFDCLIEATSLSQHCVIVTNSRRPWVQNCIDHFAPELSHLFDQSADVSKPRLEVIYAGECLESLGRPVRHDSRSGVKTREEVEEELTRAKYAAMKYAIGSCYSQYEGQSWKNVISLGDSSYERDAVKEVAFCRRPPTPERLRIKSIVLPTAPAVTEITLRLRFSRLMLRAYVHHDGDVDLDLNTTPDPLVAIAEAFGIPKLADVPFSRHAWGRVPKPCCREEVDHHLDEIAVIIQNSLFD